MIWQHNFLMKDWADNSKEVTVLYGSQTGNAQRLAKKAGKTLEEHGFQVTVSSMNDFKPKI